MPVAPCSPAPTDATEIFCGTGNDVVVFNQETGASTYDCEQVEVESAG
ncbi:hypothetical protein [Nocardioides dilutus]